MNTDRLDLYAENHHNEELKEMPESKNLVIRFELELSDGTFKLMTPQITQQTKRKMISKNDKSPDMLDEIGNEHVLVRGNVPQLLEYQKDKILMVVGHTLQLYESWQWVKTIKLDIQDNFFTMIRKASIRPYGYMSLLPGFGDIPLVLISGSKGLIVVSPDLDYSEPLILINSSTAFG